MCGSQSLVLSWTLGSCCECFPTSCQTPPLVTLILFFCFCHSSTCPVENTRYLFTFSLHFTTCKCSLVVVVYPHGFELSFSCLTLWWKVCNTASELLPLSVAAHFHIVLLKKSLPLRSKCFFCFCSVKRWTHGCSCCAVLMRFMVNE